MPQAGSDSTFSPEWFCELLIELPGQMRLINGLPELTFISNFNFREGYNADLMIKILASGNLSYKIVTLPFKISADLNEREYGAIYGFWVNGPFRNRIAFKCVTDIRDCPSTCNNWSPTDNPLSRAGLKGCFTINKCIAF